MQNVDTALFVLTFTGLLCLFQFALAMFRLRLNSEMKQLREEVERTNDEFRKAMELFQQGQVEAAIEMCGRARKRRGEKWAA